MGWMRRPHGSSEAAELHLRNLLRNIAFASWVAGLLWIWGGVLQDMALSFVAIAVALVLATKELILCVLGFFVRLSADSFRVGDRIEVKGIRGDVVDLTLLTTSILEVGVGHQRTGRSVVLPNSIFLEDTVTNETFTKEYVLHLIRIPMTVGQDWRRAEKRLLEAGREASSQYLVDAMRSMSLVSRRHGFNAPLVEPRVIVQIPEPGRLDLVLRLPTLARERGKMEQRVLRLFLDKWDELDAAASP